MKHFQRCVSGAAVLVFSIAAPAIATTSRLVTQERTFHATRAFGAGSAAGTAEVTLKYVEIVRAPSGAARSSLSREVSKFILGNQFGKSEKPVASPRALAADFFAAYADYYASSEHDGLYAHPYMLDRTVTVLNPGPHVVSLQMDETSDTGGAHLNKSTAFSNVDAQSGRVLSLNDLIVQGGSASLMRIAERYFRRTRGIPPTETFSKEGDFFSSNHGVFALPNAIGVAADGLHFHYDTYEVASFADGPTDFTIPYGSLAGVIRRNLP